MDDHVQFQWIVIMFPLKKKTHIWAIPNFQTISWANEMIMCLVCLVK